MITHLHYKKNLIDVYGFILSCKDEYEDFYVTVGKERKFITELNLIKKVLKYQQVFGIFDNGLKALLIIYKEKGFRSYVKILTDRYNYIYDLLNYLDWNFYRPELYLKIKKTNKIGKSLSYFDKKKQKTVYRYGWNFFGSRGEEILYVRKPIIRKKEIYNDSDRTNE